jgi:hypothetical protein
MSHGCHRTPLSQFVSCVWPARRANAAARSPGAMRNFRAHAGKATQYFICQGAPKSPKPPSAWQRSVHAICRWRQSPSTGTLAYPSVPACHTLPPRRAPTSHDCASTLQGRCPSIPIDSRAQAMASRSDYAPPAASELCRVTSRYSPMRASARGGPTVQRRKTRSTSSARRRRSFELSCVSSRAPPRVASGVVGCRCCGLPRRGGRPIAIQLRSMFGPDESCC